jgi:elongator complex protein 3
MVQNIFQGVDCQLDYCKIYPCLDLPYTKIREWKHSGKWKPIAENRFPEFLDFLAYTMSIIPPWTRANRVQRDFPEATEKNNQLGFVSETIQSNLQQIVTDYMKKKGMKCYDIRSREVRNELIDHERAKLYIRIYRANEGTEFFLSVEIPRTDKDFNDTSLLGLCRLRIPDYEFSEKEDIPFHYLPVFRKKERIARIRELHVYGNIVSGSQGNSQGNPNSQHRGIGKFLIGVAESISRFYECSLVTIISGVGVRDYYENIGYTLDENEDQYMIKRPEEKIDLVLFGKKYDETRIHNTVGGSTISQQYIKHTETYEESNYCGEVHYCADAQGFCL